MKQWANWGRTATSMPAQFVYPTSTGQVQQIIAAAHSNQQPVKAVGAGHSFTPVAASNGVMIDLSKMGKILAHDGPNHQVRVQAGATLRDLNPRLAALGLAFPNLGDVDPQSLAGAISTGTHGTGAHKYGIANAVIALQLVTPTGDIIEIDQNHRWFQASRLSLGALGVITEITLQLEPVFLLHARDEPYDLSYVVNNINQLTATNDHFEFYWFPHTNKTSTKRNNRVPEGTLARPLSPARAWLDDEFLSNTAFELINRMALAKKSWIPRINALSASSLTARAYTDTSYRVFISPRRVRFRESEFAIPRQNLPAALSELKQWLHCNDELVSFPVEVRFAAADNIWLSTSYGRDTAYIAVHQYYKSDYRRYFRAAQAIFLEHHGRPHWGKLHNLGAEYFGQAYEHFDDFINVRNEADPTRVMSNAYLDHILG